MKQTGKLVEQRGPSLEPLGHMVCVSCFHWNCWHSIGEECDIIGCECKAGAFH